MTDTIPVLDLHMHSSVSDGTDSPAELLRQVRAAGISVFSLTDHDALLGCVELRRLLTPGDPEFLTGVEFSCKDELGKYHVLGYAYDTEAAPIRDVIALGHGYRIKKLKNRLEVLRRDYGIRFPETEEQALFALPNPGKPHIANLMVRSGYVKTKELAFLNYLNRLSGEDDYVRPEEAIRGILGAGGIPVLAHPIYGDGDQLILGAELEQRILRLMDFGLQGLEAYYSGFPASMRAQVLELAERYELYVTAGSDYHGKNKLIPLADTGLKRETSPAAGLLRFLQAVGADRKE